MNNFELTHDEKLALEKMSVILSGISLKDYFAEPLNAGCGDHCRTGCSYHCYKYCSEDCVAGREKDLYDGQTCAIKFS